MACERKTCWRLMEKLKKAFPRLPVCLCADSLYVCEELIRKEFWYLTDLPGTRKNEADLIERGRMRWKIENEGFNAQKKHGYSLEHLYSRNYQVVKKHYYLIQIGHMTGQFMEAWEELFRNEKD